MHKFTPTAQNNLAVGLFISSETRTVTAKAVERISYDKG